MLFRLLLAALLLHAAAASKAPHVDGLEAAVVGAKIPASMSSRLSRIVSRAAELIQANEQRAEGLVAAKAVTHLPVVQESERHAVAGGSTRFRQQLHAVAGTKTSATHSHSKSHSTGHIRRRLRPLGRVNDDMPVLGDDPIKEMLDQDLPDIDGKPRKMKMDPLSQAITQELSMATHAITNGEQKAETAMRSQAQQIATQANNANTAAVHRVRSSMGAASRHAPAAHHRAAAEVDVVVTPQAGKQPGEGTVLRSEIKNAIQKAFAGLMPRHRRPVLMEQTSAMHKHTNTLQPMTWQDEMTDLDADATRDADAQVLVHGLQSDYDPMRLDQINDSYKTDKDDE